MKKETIKCILTSAVLVGVATAYLHPIISGKSTNIIAYKNNVVEQSVDIPIIVDEYESVSVPIIIDFNEDGFVDILIEDSEDSSPFDEDFKFYSISELDDSQLINSVEQPPISVNTIIISDTSSDEFSIGNKTLIHVGNDN